ncbi:MAG: carboxypeptidase regulatory-like domain-containing protein [Planctomycetes bacterium]|nr:carboxypeptidase regulatory-like domain-containing protein [Planctomycetota bacterium]
MVDRSLIIVAVAILATATFTTWWRLRDSEGPGHRLEARRPAANNALPATQQDPPPTVDDASSEFCQYLVRQSDGTPLIDADIWQIRDDRTSAINRTDDQGKARFNPTTGSARVVVGREGRLPRVFERPASRGQHVVDLSGESPTGLRLVDENDRPIARAPIRIVAEAWPGMTQDLMEFGSKAPSWLDATMAQTDEDGSCEWRGLIVDECIVSLHLPPRYRWPPDPDLTVIPFPLRRGKRVKLALALAPILTLRIVGSDSQEGLPGVEVRLISPKIGESNRYSTLTTASDEFGNVAARLESVRTAECRLLLRRGGWQHEVLRRDGPFQMTNDLGIINYPDAVERRIEFIAPDGLPIEGVRAEVTEPGQPHRWNGAMALADAAIVGFAFPRSSDAHGLLHLDTIDARVHTIIAFPPAGYAAKTVTLADDPQPLQRVQLERAGRIAVRLLDLEGRPWPHREVHLEVHNGPPLITTVRASIHPTNLSGIPELVGRTDAEGMIEFAGLDFGTTVEIRLRTQNHAVAGTTGLISVPDDATKGSFDLRPDPALVRSLRGRVVDESDRPLPGAEVRLRTSSELASVDLLATTDPDGSFEFKLLDHNAERGVFVVDAQGNLMTIVDRPTRLPAAGTQWQLRVRPLRD